ncbi:MAG: GNAT family N-acetyltransferase [Bacteroidota bacterium]|nr:GNAT family N-acetyltransferase [Bacteroidota bacterium]
MEKIAEKYNIKNLMIFTHPTHERSIGLYTKLGFTSYGISMLDEHEFIKMEINLLTGK